MIDNTRPAFIAFVSTLETSGRAQHGWGDYEIVKEDAPAHTPEPWEVWRFENADDNVSIGAKSGGVSVCEITMRDGGGRANANTIQRGNYNAARIVACVNACEGMADPAKEIERLRDALEEIAAENPENLSDKAELIRCARIARAALEGGAK